MTLVFPIVLSGGSGTRLWPLSRKAYPKQFHSLVCDRSLFQKTCARLVDSLFAKPAIFCSHDHRFIAAEQLQDIGVEPEAIVLEPESRSTAPAALIAALLANREGSDRLLLLLPSDHLVNDGPGFVSSIKAGIDAAQKGHVVVFGVPPSSPETGYGYIKTKKNGQSPLEVTSFVEKPSPELAREFISKGNYYWNAGIFLVSAKRLIEAYETHAPDLVPCCVEALGRAASDLDFLRLDKEAYARCTDVSIDYAIMEKVEGTRCVPLASDWCDLGTWPAVWQAMDKDEDGNVARGDVILEHTTGSYAHSADSTCLALVGLDDVFVVATKDAILVASKERAQSVSRVVDRLKASDRQEHLFHSRVYRPWGWYEVLEKGDRFQVKCLMLKPGGRLSLQSHDHRAEHWVVVSGAAKVTNGEDVFLLSENQSTYIPLGRKHRLENPGEVPALLIEVQSGSYLGEDDIVRYEDVYGRELEENATPRSNPGGATRQPESDPKRV